MDPSVGDGPDLGGNPVSVVGIGADGWVGLSEVARELVGRAHLLVGSTRQLGLMPETGAERLPWPSPLLPALPGLLAEHRGRSVCVLASGDPMFFGIGTRLVRLLGAEGVRVVPHVSSASLACARLGWALDDLEVVSAVGRSVAALHPAIQPGRRVLVLSADGGTPSQVASLLCARGYGDSEMSVLSQLGGPRERVVVGTAATWADPATAPPSPSGRPTTTVTGRGSTGEDVDDLNVVAIHCRADAGIPALSRSPGLPDDAFEHDGQLTKREVRAVTLSSLVPVPGQLLWDVGAGAGSIAIEWTRHHPACRAVALEMDTERAERIARNAAALGVPGLRVVHGRAPDVLGDLERPSAVFVGGGCTDEGVMEACWAALLPGGRMVANAVTTAGESVLARWHDACGGELIRLSVSRSSPVGGFTALRPMMPVTQWLATKGEW